MVNIAVVGYGNMGQTHSRVLQKLGMLSLIIEPDIKNRELAKQATDVPVSASIEEAKANENVQIDGFVIAVPTHLHIDVCEKVVKYYPDLKALLIEKPVSTTLKDGKLLKERLTPYLKRIIIGHSEVYNPVIQKLLETLSTNKNYGKIRTVSIFRKGIISKDRIPSLSGVLEDIGVHDFDIVSRLFSGKVQLYATGIYLKETLNSAIISIKGDGFQGLIYLSREFVGKERQIFLECEKASIMVDLISQIIEIRSLSGYSHTGKRYVSIPHGAGVSLKSYGEPLLEELLNLKNIITKNEAPLVGINEGIKALLIVEACKNSIKLGKPVTVEI